MSGQLKSPELKKKKKEKGMKSKHKSKPGSKHGSKPGSKHGLKTKGTKHGKGKKGRKHSKHDPNKPRKKKKSKDLKKPLPGSGPTSIPSKSVPKKSEKTGVEGTPKTVEKLVTVENNSGSLRVEKTQLSDDSLRRKKENKENKKKEKDEKKKTSKSDVEKDEYKKKKKEEKEGKKEVKVEEKKEKKEKEPKVKPVAPGSAVDQSPPTAEKKVGNLYSILGELSDTKSSVDGTPDDSKKKMKEEPKVATPDAKTPETVGPPMMEIKKEGSKKELKEGNKNGSDEGKLESEHDNLVEEPPKKKNNDDSNLKKQKSESFRLKKTQSLSPVSWKKGLKLYIHKLFKVNIAAPIAPGPPGKQIIRPHPDPNNEIVMNTPPLSDRSGRLRAVEAQRSELDQPLPEPEFVLNNGDTRVKKIDIKKVDFDLIGRTGMYMERIGMPAERKQAFDYIAYNRHDLKLKQSDFAKNMAVALSDIGINK
ncbi:hypothetical protein CRE_28473 [Caenorhabditis remanei]|uniref:Uncharacterized protein n=1 Tax=Caenorhabditis remanei TaxID=31234 RepID=E3LMM6_CAERE|nr:hypothetical protein CRE_28473 [Caenorhabditis remanei]